MVKNKPSAVVGRPVEDFSIQFAWQTGFWRDIFDKQVELVRDDIKRAQYEDRLVVYLSCPISGRGGGHKRTNADVAKHTERRLLSDWGERFWILNPAMYQMETKEGAKLIFKHAKELGFGPELLEKSPPKGGDYMRMWTRVLVEDGSHNVGGNFDAFYFLGPTDVRDFFTRGGAVTVTAGVEEYFARKFSTDPDFRDEYSVEGIRWGGAGRDPKKPQRSRQGQQVLRKQWEEARKRFFRFYGLKASAHFSLGSHDEWNIFTLINKKRLDLTKNSEVTNGDVGELLPGYFDGRQIPPGAAVTPISPGYAIT